MKIQRILRNTFFIAAGFVLLLVVAAQLSKDYVVKLVLERSAQSFQVPLSVGEVDLSLLRKFPLAAIEFNHITLVDSVNGHDTILKIKKLYASVDIQQLMDGNVYVKKVDVVGAHANYMVDKKGVSNLDFIFDAMAYDSAQAQKPDTARLQGIYALEDLTLEDIQLKYTDSLLNLAAVVALPNVDVKGELTPTGYMAAIDGEAVMQNVSYENFRLDDLNNTRLVFNLQAINDTVEVKDLQLTSAHTKASVNGRLINGEWPYFDVHFNSSITSLKHLLTLLPQNSIDEYKIHQLEGGVILQGSVNGLLTDSLLPRIEADYQIEDLKLWYHTYPFIHHLALKGSYSNGAEASGETTHIYISNFEVESKDSKLKLNGDFLNLNSLLYRLSVDADVELADWIDFVPDQMIEQMKGRVNAQISTSGTLPDSITDDFTADALKQTSLTLKATDVSFEMDSIPAIQNLSGTLRYKHGDVKVNHLRMTVPAYHFNLTDALISARYQGSLLDTSHLKVHLDTFKVEVNKSNHLSGSGYLSNLNTGEYRINTQASLHLADLSKMIPDSLVTEMSGDLNASFSSKGQFNVDSLADQAIDILLGQSVFDVHSKNLTVITPDTLASISDFSSQLSYANDSLSIRKTSGVYNLIDFEVDSASVKNLYAGFFLNKKEEITVKGNYYFGDVDYAFFVPFMGEEDSVSNNDSSESAQESVNWTYKFQGKVGLRSFNYGKALFEDIHSKVLAKPDYYVADNFSLNAFGGSMNSSAKFVVYPDNRSVASFKTDVRGMDIYNLLFDFDNFQEFYEPEITYDQVTGIFSTHMDGRIVFNEEFDVYSDSLLLKGDLRLDKGSLVKVQAVMDIEDIPMVGIKGLDNLRFSTLDSKLFIFKNKWYVPSTEIRTSSFDANFFGMSSFEEDYSYHIRLFLGEVLSSKSNKNLLKQSKDDGFDDSDAAKGRTSLYLVSRMIDGKSKAWFDKKPDRDHMQKTIRAQQGALNFIFFPKLVQFETGVE